MSDVINKIKILEELARSGDKDEVIIQVIDKLTSYKIEELTKDLKDIEARLSLFEDNIK